jgi:site-specific recombinase XerD
VDSVTEFASYLAAERGLSPTTVATYAAEARAFQAFLAAAGRTAAAARAEDVGSYIVSRQVDRVDPRTLAKAASAIRSFYRFLVLEGKIPTNPARLEDPGDPRPRVVRVHLLLRPARE